ncbi:M15 family metallopeptidase [Clostridium malenominatum]|uniref:M15 family metallopeptidase n=1 Tax=Clostridium malenominatum TaxID=1539 RepID=A0ABN1IUE8_9CLOT
MKKKIWILILTFILIRKSSLVEALENDKYERIMKQDILSLMMAYPEYICELNKESNGKVYVIMKSGRKILYDDKKEKSFEEKIANPDLQDMMEQIYPLCISEKLMDKNFDPGRGRVYPLLMEVYGSSNKEVEGNLVSVKGLRFNNKNKAGESLRKVMEELIPLAKNSGKISSCVFPYSGTFNYRYIAGTNRLSPHAFGIAIDLARDKRDYWKWATREEGEKRIGSYPKEIVEIFEKNNFIWGGKWGHFDILHFEYRPEIIMKAKYFGGHHKEDVLWYEGLNSEDDNIKYLIEKIDASL